jgi:hypothetical protein
VRSQHAHNDISSQVTAVRFYSWPWGRRRCGRHEGGWAGQGPAKGNAGAAVEGAPKVNDPKVDDVAGVAVGAVATGKAAWLPNMERPPPAGAAAGAAAEGAPKENRRLSSVCVFRAWTTGLGLTTLIISMAAWSWGGRNVQGRTRGWKCKCTTTTLPHATTTTTTPPTGTGGEGDDGAGGREEVHTPLNGHHDAAHPLHKVPDKALIPLLHERHAR